MLILITYGENIESQRLGVPGWNSERELVGHVKNFLNV